MERHARSLQARAESNEDPWQALVRKTVVYKTVVRKTVGLLLWCQATLGQSPVSEWSKCDLIEKDLLKIEFTTQHVLYK